jgi:hypothetical protein
MARVAHLRPEAAIRCRHLSARLRRWVPELQPLRSDTSRIAAEARAADRVPAASALTLR